MRPRTVVITGAGGALGQRLSRQLAGEPGTDLVLSDVSRDLAGRDRRRTARHGRRPDGHDAGRRQRLRPGRGRRRAGRRTLRPPRRADQQRRRALAQRPDPQPAPRTGSVRSGSTSRRRQRDPRRGAVMRPQQSGSIVLTASVSGLTAWSHAAPYCATKAAVIQLAKVAAVEYARDGIRVNCVCPGTFRSAIHADLPAGGARRHRRAASAGAGLGRRPGRRLLLPGRATRRAGRPGRRIVVDGGYSAP